MLVALPDQGGGDYADLGVSITSVALTTFTQHPVGILLGVSLGIGNEAGAFNDIYKSLDMIQYYNRLNSNNNGY